MLKINKIAWLLFLILAGCVDPDPNTPPTGGTNDNATEYKPVLMTRTELSKSGQIMPPLALSVPGKIYMKDEFLFITEKYKGIHIYNNSNPANPVNLVFISVPGCVDVAVKDDVLYADNATDLLAFDISNPQTPVFLKRIMDVFPPINPPDLDFIPSVFAPEKRPPNTIIVGWEKY